MPYSAFVLVERDTDLVETQKHPLNEKVIHRRVVPEGIVHIPSYIRRVCVNPMQG
jgi:hypothetical protein